MIQLSCSKCGGANRPNARFCIHCGQPLPRETTPRAMPLEASSTRGPSGGGASGRAVPVTPLQHDASRPRRLSRALAVAGGGCLIGIGVFAVAMLFVVMQLRRAPNPPPVSVVPTSQDVSEPTAQRPSIITSTPLPEVSSAFPAQLVGSWAYSDDNGSWLYTFNDDGSYQRTFDAEIVAFGCSVKISRHEEGLATIDDSTLVLDIRSGEKQTTDSCDSSKNALRDLAGTTDTFALQADVDGDRVVRLYVDKVALQPYSPNS
jgi:hypothetical protein